MSWDRTYSHNLLIGLDALGAIVFWNVEFCTISSLCRIVEGVDTEHACPVDEPCAGCDWNMKLDELKLYRWQEWLLHKLWPLLNRIQANHCELARQGDIARAKRTLELLE